MVRSLLTFLCSLFFVLSVQAAPSKFSYQGQIIKPNGQPLEDSAVTFTIEILSPLPTECVLYEETHLINMDNSNGIFSLEVGGGAQSGGDYEDLATLSSALSNSTGAVTPTTCVSGPSYTPVSGDGRQLRVTFDDGTGPNTIVQNHQIVSVPYADSASSVDGLTVGDLLIVDTSGSNVLDQTNLVWLFESTRFAELQALVNGTSTNYLTSSPSGDVSMNNQKVVDVADPTAANDAANKNYVDGNIGGQATDSVTLSGLGAGDSGEVLVWNGTQWTSAAPVGDSTKLALAGGTMTGDIDMGTNNITNANNVTATSVGTNSLAVYNGANYMGFQAAPGSADLLWVLPAADGSANQALSTDASGNLSWRSYIESASNQGTGGVGPFKQNSSGDLEFKNINAGSSKVTITDDAGNDEIDIDVDESNFDLATIPNTAAGNIGATDAQAAIDELDAEKVAKAGDSMTGALTMNAQNEVRFADSDSSNYVGFVAPAVVAADLVWTLPAADGSPNQVLETDGFGNLQWHTLAAVGESNTSSNQGSAGIGVFDNKNGVDFEFRNINDDGNGKVTVTLDGANKEIDLSVDESNLDASAIPNTAAGNIVATNIQAAINELDTQISGITIDTVEDADGNTLVQVEEGANDDTIRFDTAGSERMIIDPSGNIGIGTTTPTNSVEVYNGSILINDGIANQTTIIDENFFGISRTSDGIFSVKMEAPASVNGARQTMRLSGREGVQLAYDTQGRLEVDNTGVRIGIGGADSSLGVAAAPLHVVGNSFFNGSVGIGTDAPARKVHVAGTDVNMILDGAGGGGDPITTFTLKRGTQEFSLRSGIGGLNDFDIFDDANNLSRLMIKNSGNIGIGTTTPNSLLEVAGDIQIGNSSVACTAANEGAIRYNAGTVEFCDDTPVWVAFGTAAGGEVNTYSNSGVGGVGIVLTKSGSDLPFKSINAGSNKIAVTDDAGNNEVDIDVDESNFDSTQIPNTATGNIVANNVQGAINELDTEKVAATRSINTVAGSGLQGGGDLSSDRSLSLDIPGVADFAATIASNDTLLVYDTDATTMLEVQRSDLVLTEAEVDAYANNNGYAADTDVLKKDGSVALTSDWDVGGTNTITNLPTPTAASEAAPKGYVDTVVGGISTDSIEDADANTMIQLEEGANDDTIRFDTAGSERMLIDPSGNIGVGTTSPASKMHISSGNMQIGESTMTSGNPSFSLYGYDTVGTAARYGRFSVAGDGSFQIQAEDSYLILDSGSYIQTQKAVNMTAHALLFSGTQVLGSADAGATFHLGSGGAITKVQVGNAATTDTVIPFGDVGIGTDNPAHLLDMRFSAGSGLYVQGPNGSADLGKFQRGGSDSFTTIHAHGHDPQILFNTQATGNGWNIGVDSDQADQFVFGYGAKNIASASPALVVETSGNIGIGTTTPDYGIGYSSETTVVGVSGDGTASASTSGVLVLSNNRATPTVGDTTGSLDFVSAGNGTGVAQLGARIKSTLSGTGGANGFGHDIIFYTKNDNAAGISEKLRLTNNGYLGVGTDAPDVALDVHTGSINATEICDENNANCLDLNNLTVGGDFLADGSVPMTGAFEADFGTAAAPSITFDGDEDTGLFRAGDGRVGVSRNGSRIVEFGLSGYDIFFGSSGQMGSYDGVSITIDDNNSGNAAFKVLGGSGSRNLFSIWDDTEFVGIGDDNPDAHLEISASGTSGGTVLMVSSDDNNDGDLLTILEDGNVGIGTTTPTHMLDVNGNIRAQGERFYNNDDNDYLEIHGADEEARFVFNNNTPVVTIRSDGNVGIGTTTPTGVLDIEGGDVFIGTGTLTNASGNEDLSVTGNLEVDGTIYGNGSGLSGVVASSSDAGDNSGDFVINADSDGNASGDVKLQVDGNDRLVVSNTNEVLIKSNGGLSDTITLNRGNGSVASGPDILIDANGVIAAEDSLFYQVDSDNTTTTTAHIFKANAETNGGDELMRIQENGNVGIGTTSSSTLLQMGTGLYLGEGGLSGDASTGSDIRAAGAAVISAESNVYINLDSNNDTGGAKFFVSKDRSTNSGGTDLFVVEESGNVGIGTDNPGQKLSVAGTIESTSGGVRYPDATTQTTAAANPVMSWMKGGLQHAPGTAYGALGGTTTLATENYAEMPVPRAGTFQKLYCRFASAQPASGSLTVTFRKNGADTSLVVTFPASGGAGTYSDTSNSVSVVATDLISLKIVNSAAGASGDIVGCYVEFAP